MAALAVQPAMNVEDRKLHPFFVKSHKDSSSLQTTDIDQAAPAQADHDDVEQDPCSNNAQPLKGRKKRNRQGDGRAEKHTSIVSGEKSQASLERFTRNPNGQCIAEEINVVDQDYHPKAEITIEEDPNQERRKRRKTTSPPQSPALEQNVLPQHSENVGWHQQLQIEAARNAGPPSVAPVSVLSVPAQAVKEDVTKRKPSSKQTPPKKVLKINQNGKLLSSPPAKTEPSTSNSPRRTRGRRSAKTKSVPTVTIIKYGFSSESRAYLGQKINEILAGEKSTVKAPRKPPQPTIKPAGPPKATHPFFLGKAPQAPSKDEETVLTRAREEVCEPLISKAPRKSAVTPGKLRVESGLYQPSQPLPIFAPIGIDSKVMKHPGMSEAPWPSRETAHVRNLDITELETRHNSSALKHHVSASRKLKSLAIMIKEDENLISRCERQLMPIFGKNRQSETRNMLPTGDVRLPKRLLTTGYNIRELVKKELDAASLMFVDRDSQLRLSDPHLSHPVLKALYEKVEDTLTPFDKGICESKSWTHKYAPDCAANVLQLGQEVSVLRDWLKNHTVQAVESRKDESKPVNEVEARKPPKKKRRQAEDDFIVSNDEDDEDDELIELPDSESGAFSSSSHEQKSLVRAGGLKRGQVRLSKNRNIVVISGPHGCGKSAAVYAVAKELDFEVFEINSSSRRSGKDIQDRVGNMSENHLVNRKQDVQAAAELSSTEDADHERMSEAFQKDLASGRQGTVMSFFAAKPKSKPEIVSKAKPIKEPPRTNTGTQSTLPKAQRRLKQQKQSLILFEEVDVLFEEDQQFWAQVFRLAQNSKRPIIITCNDEGLLPLAELPLFAILRLSPPPVELVTKYLLLLAANEGHLLAWEAVRDLYNSKHYDLRASITELDFWCQMSVGDRKGGLEWIYQRWPPGRDVDEHGRILRVASQGTYQSGMGWLSHDITTSVGQVSFDRHHELSKEAWENWGLSPQSWDKSENQQLVAGRNQLDEDLTRKDRLNKLRLFERRLDAASSTDCFCRVGLPWDHNGPLDPSSPHMPDKERLNYTLAFPVLQTDPVTDFSDFDTNIFIASHLGIQYQIPPQSSDELISSSTISVDEKNYTRAILQHKSGKGIEQSLSRHDFSEALDVLAVAPETASITNQLIASSFDRTFKLIVEDLAPYVRSIVAHDLRLEAQRIRLSNLLSEGGQNKRSRTTRASRTALEGGTRQTKRRELWFDKDLNFTLVMNTAGKNWAGLGSTVPEDDISRTGESLYSTPDA